MDLRAKLTILAEAAKYDASCASSGAKRAGDREGLGNAEGVGICHSYTPDGRCVSLLKLLLTNHCIYDCLYCTSRASSDTPRARFAPREVVELTLEFYRRNYIEGLFLSSGVIKSLDFTMEQMAEVARSLREDHGFRGYIHLKAVPGASPELLERAGRHADRSARARRARPDASPTTPSSRRCGARTTRPSSTRRAFACARCARTCRRASMPEARSLPLLREAASCCQGCDIHRCGTRMVFGAGPADARVMLVGEQPGDVEDREGRPFVGPAGALLAEVLAEVGLDRRALYLTNAVKHFKFTPRGARRIHQRPSPGEIRACAPWLRAEVEALYPRMILCLGATAAQSFWGPGFRLAERRGEPITTAWAPWWMATYHPAAILRMPDESARSEARRLFTADRRRLADDRARY